MTDLKVQCRCGTLKGVLRDVAPNKGSHLVCYCKDCQTAARHLKADDLLLERGGTDVFQSLPSRLELAEGQEHLACLRLSPNGLMRWYATCCQTPMFNTLSKPGMPFVSVLTHAFEQGADTVEIGPVVAVHKAEQAAPGPGALKNHGVKKVILRFLLGVLASKLKRERSNPFFDDAGRPVVVPTVLTKEERRAATPE